MTSRERVRRTFQFTPTDRVPYDLMEGAIWPELMEHFRGELGIANADDAIRHFDLDFRWFWPSSQVPEGFWATYAPGVAGTYSDNVGTRPLRHAETVADIERHPFPDPAWWDASGIAQFRRDHPHHAVVLATGWLPLFCTACEILGMEEAIAKMVTAPNVFQAFVERQNEFYCALLERCCTAAEGIADICWLGDDYASQRALIMSPDLWRRYLKKPLRRQAEIAKRHGMFLLMHSCGAVRAILPDFIDIGIDGLLTFQTTAEGMDAKSIARDFGGKLVFYGGIDVQSLLPFGSEDDVRREVRLNIDLFADCGGYIVANAHHGISNIRSENIIAMLTEARGYRRIAGTG